MALLIFIAVVARAAYAFRDRNPGYLVDLSVASATPSAFSVGFAKVKINPDLGDPNKPVWIAGFGNNKRATAIHDDLWAVAFVIDDGPTRIGIVSLDAIGFFHDDAIAVRKLFNRGAKDSYTIVCSTHNHATPDLMGLWGPSHFRTGVRPEYRQLVIQNAAQALREAAAKLEPAAVRFHHIPTAPEGLVTDSRKPVVFDPDLRVMHFVRPGTTNTIGSVVTWGNHPETVWSKNTELTADFCGYLREELEKTFGGIHCYVNGAIGGLMTTSPSVTVTDPETGAEYKEPTHDKARALGRQLFARVKPALLSSSEEPVGELAIGLRARSFEIPLENKLFLLAPVLGVLDRGHSRWKHLRTEVAMLTLGDASIACVPGEIYPEIVNGGIETPPGADYPVPPVEVPPIRDFMPGKHKFIFGLANDEIGYIIPRSEWDQKPPYLYDSKKGVYGEINSVGPAAAEIIHRELKSIAAEFQHETIPR